ncbi:hypothetical protein MVES_001820 [Malassezia vespertilionis]|uniref:SLC41A/MgtE integral membrane domain-containing protein n=1 Tax=Malassezia vespertilionis TaxID=2020962 RepID=A0A2N1JDC8_9BASI|nr:hypothetical protein MVES_001820 [Malassezia vespertilionis]
MANDAGHRADTPPEAVPEQRYEMQSTASLLMQTLPMLIVALLGLLLSGAVLANITHWSAFSKVDKFFILVPIMMNLKGNLELNLSLRMSTAANIGELDNRRTRRAIVLGNMALLQAQALIVAFAAGILSFILGSHDRSPSDANVHARGQVHTPGHASMDRAARLQNGYFEFALVLAVSMLAASLSSAVQGMNLCALVILSRCSKMNPDNTVVPIAGSLGDLIAITMLGLLAAGMLQFEGTGIATVVFSLLIILCIVFLVVTLRNAYVHELVAHGWTPLFSAALISSFAGVLLDKNAARFEGLPLLSPIVAGLPGVAAAILVSSMSSALHSGNVVAPTRSVTQGEYVPLTQRGAPERPAASSVGHGILAQVLASLRPCAPLQGWRLPIFLLLSTSGVQIGFVFLLRLLGFLRFGWLFGVLFSVLTVLLICTALCMSHWLCFFLWYWDFDPDTSCMPCCSLRSLQP